MYNRSLPIGRWQKNTQKNIKMYLKVFFVSYSYEIFSVVENDFFEFFRSSFVTDRPSLAIVVDKRNLIDSPVVRHLNTPQMIDRCHLHFLIIFRTKFQMIALAANKSIMRSKFPNNAFLNFDLMINLLAERTIMRSKL